MPSEYQLSQALLALRSAQHRLENDGELGDDEIELLRAEEDIKILLERAVRAALHAESMEDAAAQRIKALQIRKDRYKRRAEAMRGAVFAAMDALDETRFEMPEALVTKGNGTSTTIIPNEDAVPAEYKKTTVTIDKAKINADIKQGVVIEGVEVSNGIGKLTIRTL